MKSVLMSIQPKWCELIANGKKTIEVRKTKPKLEVPFKVYMYCTSIARVNLDEYANIFRATLGRIDDWHGKVIGEFVCNNILKYECEFVDDDCYENISCIGTTEDGDELGFIEWSNDEDTPYEDTCLYKTSSVSYDELKKYMGLGFGEFYAWHISDLVIYNKPKALREFRKYNPFFEGISTEELEAEGVSGVRIKRPPQSWCYVEERSQPKREKSHSGRPGRNEANERSPEAQEAQKAKNICC